MFSPICSLPFLQFIFLIFVRYKSKFCSSVHVRESAYINLKFSKLGLLDILPQIFWEPNIALKKLVVQHFLHCNLAWPIWWIDTGYPSIYIYIYEERPKWKQIMKTNTNDEDFESKKVGSCEAVTRTVAMK